jgi:hypothetical protein
MVPQITFEDYTKLSGHRYSGIATNLHQENTHSLRQQWLPPSHLLPTLIQQPSGCFATSPRRRRRRRHLSRPGRCRTVPSQEMWFRRRDRLPQRLLEVDLLAPFPNTLSVRRTVQPIPSSLCLAHRRVRAGRRRSNRLPQRQVALNDVALGDVAEYAGGSRRDGL